MPEYLATGRNAEGTKVTERVEAGSADEAMRALGDRGFSELVLHTDDTSALYTRQSEVDEVISPGEYLWYRHMPGRLASFLLIAIKLYQKTWLSCLVMLALLSYRRYLGQAWNWPDSLMVALLLLPSIWAVGAQFLQNQAAKYERLIDAVAWGRWEEALGRVDAVGRGVPPEELAIRKAQALAGLGRLDEALAIVEPFGDGELIPEWLYLSRLADVYLAADREEDAVAVVEEALELAPENATVLLELARMEVWYRQAPGRAGELLARAREHALSDVLLPFATFIEGLIHLEEGRAREAIPLLERAHREVSAFRHASPLVGAALDQMHVALALACADVGETQAAGRYFRLALPRLRALRHDDLIARCERAIGLPHEG